MGVHLILLDALGPHLLVVKVGAIIGYTGLQTLWAVVWPGTHN